MKRISWNLPEVALPEFRFYDTDNKTKEGQAPITEAIPADNSYFIGTTGIDTKLLCYHISDGKYIVVSYNRNTEIIFKDIINIYKNVGININKGPDSNPTAVSINPTSVSIINLDGTVNTDETEGEQDE